MIYDAFLVHSDIDGDKDFVHEMANILERKPNNFNLFIPGRDDIGREQDTSELTDLIQNRCRKVIVVISSNFYRSDSANRRLNFVHGSIFDSAMADKYPFIPIYLEDCIKPAILNSLTPLLYYDNDVRHWFWSRLVRSLTVSTLKSKPKSCLTFPDVVLDSVCTKTYNGIE